MDDERKKEFEILRTFARRILNMDDESLDDGLYEYASSNDLSKLIGGLQFFNNMYD
jgi:hypothetical protein